MINNNITTQNQIPSLPLSQNIGLNKDEYRSRINKLYNDIKNIKPMDNSINNVIYVQKGIEKGLLVNTNVNTLRQMWTEFRLLYNELQLKDNIASEKEEHIIKETRNYSLENGSYILNNFDEIFDELNKKVDGVNGIVGELNEMKHKVASGNLVLNANKKSFELYMQEERRKLEKEKEELALLQEAQEHKIKEEKYKISKHYEKINELVRKINDQMDKLYQNNV